VAGEVRAGELVRLACARQLRDIEAWESGNSKWNWQPESGSRVCRFIEHLQHVKGRWKSPTIELEPWQCWLLTTLFGWVDGDGFRRYRTAYIEVPRKNAKALALDTPIPTPSGWTTMGVLRVGDTVLDDMGAHCTVIAESEVFTDHDCYEMNFSNGESIVADAGHRWATSTVQFGTNIYTTLEIFATQEWGHVLPGILGVEVMSVRKVEPVPTKCIAVDSPSHMFLCGRTMLPTHNTTICAGVALFMLCADGEPGPEVYSTAVTKDQARISWDTAAQMVKRDSEMRAHYGVEPLAHSITVESAGGYFKPLARDADSLEGLNPHCAIVDELHAHKTREVWDVINIARGSRRQSLLLAITTAGENKAGVCYEQHNYTEQILRGRHEDDSYFGVVYTLDPEDDWTTVESARKANPNYGVSVLPDDIEMMCRQARANADSQNTYLTKRLNLWVSVGTAYFNMLAWERLCKDDKLRLEDFTAEPCIFTLDLATKRDLTTRVAVFRRGERYYVFGKHYLPSDSLEPGRPNYDFYRGWARDGWLTLTEGNITDYDFVERDLREDSAAYRPLQVGVDPNYNAGHLTTRMLDAGLPMIEVAHNVMQFSEPMKQLEALIVSGRIKHCGDPVLTWAMGNVVAKVDVKGNVYPRRTREENKIDPAVSLIANISLHMRFLSQDSVYANPDTAVM
jgi:phage terminase large subunit-like protein